jgi:predicted nucleic acid-binding protein
MTASISPRKFIIDANILFSFLISGRKVHLEFLTDNRIFAPDFLLQEIQIHQNVIRLKSKLPSESLETFALTVFDKLTIVPNMLISNQSYLEAFTLCRDIDPKDMEYVALSIELSIPLLTRDKPLVAGLRAKGFMNVILLDELMSQNET